MNDDAAQHPTGAELTIDDGSSLFTGRVGEFLSPEMLYRTLVEQIPVVTFIELMDGGGVPHFLSPQIETLLGHPPGYWQERPSRWIEAIHPDDLPAWQA